MNEWIGDAALMISALAVAWLLMVVFA